MKTIFYKIIDKNDNVVYIGITTRTINQRFIEHIRNKSLNDKDYSIVEIDELIHPCINSLEQFYKERVKVATLEQKYIQEYKDKGYNLLNISVGGEWGGQILNKLHKTDFFNKYGTYNGYEKQYNNYKKCKSWINCWLKNRTISHTKRWLYHWREKDTNNCTKKWLKSWVYYYSKNPCKKWLYNWINITKQNKTKSWLKSWISNTNKNKTRNWLQYWIKKYTISKTKHWLKCWKVHRTQPKIKVWLQNWKNHKAQAKIKIWLTNWKNHRLNKGYR